MTPPQPLQIEYAARDSQLFIAFEGHATHQASLAAEHIVAGFLDAQSQPPMIILDLAGCAWVDSTFSGWMIRLRQRTGARHGEVVISHCPPACLSSLTTMGLTALFHFAELERPPDLCSLLCEPEAVTPASIEFMLEAHESLASTSPANQRVFGRIAEQLRRELSHRHN